MLLFERVVVLVRVRPEAYFLHHHLDILGVKFFLPLLLVVEELAVIQDFGYRRIGFRADLHQNPIPDFLQSRVLRPS